MMSPSRSGMGASMGRYGNRRRMHGGARGEHRRIILRPGSRIIVEAI